MPVKYEFDVGAAPHKIKSYGDDKSFTSLYHLLKEINAFDYKNDHIKGTFVWFPFMK